MPIGRSQGGIPPGIPCRWICSNCILFVWSIVGFRMPPWAVTVSPLGAIRTHHKSRSARANRSAQLVCSIGSRRCAAPPEPPGSLCIGLHSTDIIGDLPWIGLEFSCRHFTLHTVRRCNCHLPQLSASATGIYDRRSRAAWFQHVTLCSVRGDQELLTAIYRSIHGFSKAQANRPPVAKMKMKTTASSFRESRSVCIYDQPITSTSASPQSQGLGPVDPSEHLRKHVVKTSSSLAPLQVGKS